jgi:cobalt-zinc-cadmium efflux system outer membrane protein
MKSLTAVLLFLALAAPAAAQGNARLGLKDFLAEVRANNPEIAAASALSKAYAARIKQAWQPMDPTVEFERMYAGGALGSGAAERNILIRQEFRNPYKMYLQRGAAAAESGYYAARGGDKANRVLAEAKAAFYEYALAWHNERVYAENLELARKFASIAETRYAVSQASQSDAIKAQVELSKAMNRLITAGQEKETAAARLNALRGKSPAEALAEPELPAAPAAPSDYAQLEARVLAKNPGLAAMAAGLKAARKKASLARAEYAPDFMLSWRKRASDDAAMDGTYDVALGLTVPLWFGRTAAAGGEARAGRDLAEAEYEAARSALLLELKEVSVKLDYYRRLKELYSGTVLSQAEVSLKASEAAYQAGKTDFLDLLDASRTLLEIKSEYYEYTAAYAAWLGRLESLVGEDL